MGGDLKVVGDALRRDVSIHAPAWGATLGASVGACDIEVSIHAPAWGATHERELSAPDRWVSIHAPAWGATFHRWCCSIFKEGFNPRPRMGGDLDAVH